MRLAMDEVLLGFWGGITWGSVSGISASKGRASVEESRAEFGKSVSASETAQEDRPLGRSNARPSALKPKLGNGCDCWPADDEEFEARSRWLGSEKASTASGAGEGRGDGRYVAAAEVFGTGLLLSFSLLTKVSSSNIALFPFRVSASSASESFFFPCSSSGFISRFVAVAIVASSSRRCPFNDGAMSSSTAAIMLM